MKQSFLAEFTDKAEGLRVWEALNKSLQLSMSFTTHAVVTCVCGNVKPAGDLVCGECMTDIANHRAALIAGGKFTEEAFDRWVEANGLGEVGKCCECGKSYVWGGYYASIEQVDDCNYICTKCNYDRLMTY